MSCRNLNQLYFTAYIFTVSESTTVDKFVQVQICIHLLCVSYTDILMSLINEKPAKVCET